MNPSALLRAGFSFCPLEKPKMRRVWFNPAD
jgi:hypothetical protein